MADLAGKTVLVTGGSTGIGFATARMAADSGARVVIVSRHSGDLQTALAQLPGKQHLAAPADVSSEEQVVTLFSDLGSRGIKLNALINAAGVYGPIGPLHLVDAQEWLHALQINLFGTFLMCRYALPALIETHGSIVNFSGGGASAPFPNYSAYAASKTAVVRLTENIAEEYRDAGVRCNVIAPGFVATRLHQETLKAGERAGRGFLEKTKKQLEQGAVPAEKPAALAVFLCSDESRRITGKMLSAAWDDWQSRDFQDSLSEERDLCTLRRIDRINFDRAGRQA